MMSFRVAALMQTMSGKGYWIQAVAALRDDTPQGPTPPRKSHYRQPVPHPYPLIGPNPRAAANPRKVAVFQGSLRVSRTISKVLSAAMLSGATRHVVTHPPQVKTSFRGSFPNGPFAGEFYPNDGPSAWLGLHPDRRASQCHALCQASASPLLPSRRAPPLGVTNPGGSKS